MQVVTPAPETLNGWQARLETFDRERGWDAVLPEHSALHAMEELGEVARELLVLAAYKTPDPAVRERLAGEMADLHFLLLKLANQTGVNLQDALAGKLAQNEARFPIEPSRAAMDVYEQARRRPEGEG
ncbi:MAG TPA: MazG-like family protein [Deinococcales bacterium]|nr:MazG-like family protein [Deinococcales bacterium]